MRLKLQLLAVVAAIALSNAVPLNRFDSDGNTLRLDRRNGSFDSEFGSVCVIDDVLYQVGDYVPPTSPCERCICEPPTISCSPLPCDFKPNCKALKMSDQCCTIYQCECEHNGRVYQNGERLENPENPCNVCYCRGGEVSCTTIECYRRDDCEPQYVPGRCCPKYDHCPPIDQPRLEKTRPQFVRTDFNRDATASADPTVQQRNGLFDLDNEASEDVTATAFTTAALEQHLNATSTEGDHTVKLQTTDASPVHHDISVKQNIGDEVQFTADDSEILHLESRIVPLVPVTQQPTEDNTSSISSEEGSGTTSLNDGAVSSSTKLEVDVSSGDGEGSGTREPEQQTESNFHTTSADDNPQVRIISGTSESVESNEVVTDSSTVDYSRTVTKKQSPESTKVDEQLTTVTSPIETESFLVNEKSGISGEVETVTQQNSLHQTNPSEFFTTTGEGVTDSNEVIDEGKTTQGFDVKLRISSDELASESVRSTEMEPSSSEEGSDAKLKSTTITDQDIDESKTNIIPTEAALTTLPEADQTPALVNSSELKRVHLISSSTGVRVYNAGKDDTQQQTDTESFTNLENEFPVLPFGSVLINSEMDVVLATTEAAQPTNGEEIGTTSSLLQADAEKLTPSERTPGLKESSLHQETVAAGSDVSQKLVLEHTVDPTEVTTVEEDQNSRDTTTVVPVLIKSAPLLTRQSVDEATILQSTDKTDNILPTTTEITLQDETTGNKDLSNQQSSEDLTTLPSELEEITAVTESTDVGKSTGTPNQEESTTISPETVQDMDISHSQLSEIKARQAVDSSNTEESTTAFTEAPKLGTTVLEEFSTQSAELEAKQSRETTTEHSLSETTTDNPEAFVRLASDINVETANSEAVGTTKSEDVTESNEKALLRDASSVQLQSAEVETTTSLGDQELLNTNNDNIRTEIYQQETTEVTGSHDAVTEVQQRSGLIDEPSESLLNDSSTTLESIMQNDSAEETTSVPEVVTHLGAGSSNLAEKVAVKLLEEHKTEASLSEQTTDQPKADDQELDGLSTKLPKEDEFSTEGTTSLPVETSTLLSEQSELQESFFESEAPKSITISPGESFTTLPTSSEVEESTTQYSAEETTLKGTHSTTPTANIKREIAASNEPEEGAENPTTSGILSDDPLLQQRAADISSTEEVASSEEVTTEISNLNLNNSETHVKLASFKQEETYTSTPEVPTTEESSFLEDSTQQSAESSTKLYMEAVTNVFHESELARVVARDGNQNDTEIESTTLPREWLKSDNSSEIVTEAEENPTFVTEISTRADIQETTAAHEDESASTNTSLDSNSTTVNRNLTGIANPEHTAKARSVDNFDINLGDDNSFIRPEESVSNIEYHSSLNGHDVRDPEKFHIVDDFFTRLFHRQDVAREDDVAVI